MSEQGNRYAVPAVERAFAILEILASTPQSMGISELATLSKLPKSSLFMILTTFENHGFAERDGSGKYRLTLKLYNLAMRHLQQLEVRDVARPYLEQLSQETGLTVHMAVLDGGKAVYIDKVEGPGFVQFATRVGQSFHLHLSGVGKALAAFLPDNQLEDIIREHGLPAATPNTMTSAETFKQFLAAVRACGYAIEDEEGEPGIRCIGAPVFGQDGRVLAAISVTALRNDLPSIRFSTVGETAAACARTISDRLGYRGIGSQMED